MTTRNRTPLRERLNAAIQVIRYGHLNGTSIRKSVKKAPFAWPVQVDGAPQWTLYDFDSFVDEGFNTNAVIYSAIMYKVKSVSLAPLRAYTGERDKPELVADTHPLAMLLKRPNPFQTMRQFMGHAIAHLNIAGNAYIYLDRASPTERPTQMFILRPDRVQIVPGAGGVKGYWYTPEGKAQRDGVAIPPQYIIHVKFPNPGDLYEGMGEGLSPIAPLAQSGDVDNRVTEFLDRLFKTGTMAFGVLKFTTPLSDTTIERLRTEWDEMYGGSEKWGRPIVLDSGGEYQRGVPSFQELGFDAIDERNEARMLGPFGVPAILLGMRLGLKHATYSNADSLNTQFWQLTMEYELDLFEDGFQYALDDGDTFVLFDKSAVPALQDDLGKLVVIVKDLVSVGVPLNIATKKAGLDMEDIEGGDVGYLPLSLVPAMGKIPKNVPTPLTPPAPVPEPLQNPPTPDQNPPEGSGSTGQVNDQRQSARIDRTALIKRIKGIDIRPTPKHIEWDDTRAEKVWRQQDRIAKSWEARYHDAAKTAFENDRKALLALVSEEKQRAHDAKATIAWERIKTAAIDYLKAKAVTNWRETFIPSIRGLVTDAGNYWATELGMAFNVTNLFALEWFDQYTLRFAQEINDTTKTGIADLLQQAQAEGWTIEQGSKRLGLLFDQWMQGNLTPEEFEWFQQRLPAYRLEMIMRTETIRSYGAGTVALFAEWGIEQKQWWAALDERTCDFCMAMHGKIISMGENFLTLGETLTTVDAEDVAHSMDADFEDVGYPPLHVLCRCTVLPVT